MQLEQSYWSAAAGWAPHLPGRLDMPAQLVFVFGSAAALRTAGPCADLRSAYPAAMIVGCSTAGEIVDTRVLDDTIVATAVHFSATRVRSAMLTIEAAATSFAAGTQLAAALREPDLVHVFVLSEGLNINGSELVQGLTQALPAHVTVTGGLAADGPHFAETVVVWNGVPQTETIAAIGLYGSRLRIGYGSLGGWDTFGPDRLITRSVGNVLYELDGTSALELYKRYLGAHAANLPASGLLFPLSLSAGSGEERVVRTLLGIDEATGSITFAGDVPEGAYARLMKANFDRLIDGASSAASASMAALDADSAELALLVSCVGRKLVLQQRIEEEIEAVRDVLGARPTLAGFYSYGEISPLGVGSSCALHNQTMTITTLAEV
jgi:hypothetical protein